jgi:hypothetical protein
MQDEKVPIAEEVAEVGRGRERSAAAVMDAPKLNGFIYRGVAVVFVTDHHVRPEMRTRRSPASDGVTATAVSGERAWVVVRESEIAWR